LYAFADKIYKMSIPLSGENNCALLLFDLALRLDLLCEQGVGETSNELRNLTADLDHSVTVRGLKVYRSNEKSASHQ
jgi:hypothetical protein